MTLKQNTNSPVEEMKKLSIVMPFFNHPDLTAVMIDSILTNDYQDWELLAIDDGSTEETRLQLKHYEADQRIRFISRNREPKGAQTCRNIGLEQAEGEFIIFFDADDYVAPYCLSNRVAQMEQHPEVDFMVFRSGIYHEQQFRTEAAPLVFGYPIYKDDLAALIRRTLPFIVWSNIYRTSSLRRARLTWDTNILSYQDSDFNRQALLHHLTYAYAPTLPDYGYRTGGNTSSISKKIASEAHRQSHLYFLNKQYEEVQRIHGHHYDKALYQGVLYVYSEVLTDGLDASFANSMADIVSRHDPWRGRVLRMKIRLTQVLEKVLPRKLARQLPMPMFLIQKRRLEHDIPRRIARMQ